MEGYTILSLLLCLNVASAFSYELHLAGEGSLHNQGRVDIFANGQWGTVCDDLWGLEDANVVCRELGFAEASDFTTQAGTFGEGSGKIYLDNVECVGNETSIMDCPQNEFGRTNCGHWQDAGVICREVRLAGEGSSSSQGRVEVFTNGEWGTVCDDSWGLEDANVVCRQLGFRGASHFTRQARLFGEGSGEIHLNEVECRGDEASIMFCQKSSVGKHDCHHEEDAGVICLVDQVVRLGGKDKDDDLGLGVVEVYRDGQWGTVCGIGWTQEDANVVCKQLGFTDPAVYYFDGTSWKLFGSGTGGILLADVACTGDEHSILDCPSSTEISFFCTHLQDAEVQCLESDYRRKMEDLDFLEKGDMTEEEKVAAEEGPNDKKDSDLKKKDVLQALADLLAELKDK